MTVRTCSKLAALVLASSMVLAACGERRPGRYAVASSAATATTLTTSAGVTVNPDGGSRTVDPGLVISSTDSFDGATVMISSGFVAGEDVLSFTDQSGITGTYNATSGVLTLTGTATAATYQTAMASVSYWNGAGAGATTGLRRITFSLGSSLYFSDTGHYYEFVAAPGLSWTAAQAAAAARSHFGLQGYLATITSDAENAFIHGKLAGLGWIGASTPVSSVPDYTLPRTWSWMTGPEAGTAFFTQTSMYYPAGNLWVGGGTAIGGLYNGFDVGEPNNSLGYENCAHMRPNGWWNDYADTDWTNGYVVEYGGMAGDPVVTMSGTKTLQVGFALTFQTDGTAGATITGTSPQYVSQGADATAVTAVPPATSYFVSWTGTGSFGPATTSNPLTVAGVASDMVITAQFAPKTAQTITFSPPATATHGDPDVDLAGYASGGGSGQPVTFSVTSGPGTIVGTVLTFTGAGPVVVTASQAGDATFLPAADVEATIVVAKAAATVTLGALAQTYDGTPRVVTATTVPAGLTVSLTYDGSASAPAGAGTYAVVGTIQDANYQGTASGTLVVAKAAATVTLGALAQTYDGTPRVVTATTAPAGLTVSLTYDGSATAPTGAGTYAVVGTIQDANYQGTASGTLVVAKAAATVTLGALAQTYDGTPRVVTATTVPAGLTVSLTYDGSASAPANAGTYAVVGTIQDGNYQGTASGTLVVGKATASVSLGSLAQTYDGTARTATATTVPAGLTVSLTYDGSATAPVDAGTYAVVGTIQDGNYQGTASGTLVVGKAAATVTLGALAQTYDGTARTATATTVPAGLTVSLTYDGSATAPVDAGTYAVVGTIQDGNYQGSASGTLVVGKATSTTSVAVQSSRRPSRHGRPIVFTATVTSPYGTPTGTVTFKTGDTVLGVGTLAGGVATATVRTLVKSASPWPIVAEYAGTANLAPVSGSLVGGQVVENSPPVAGSGTSLSFGATGADRATIHAAGALDTAAFTVEAWVKPAWTSAAEARGPAPTVLSLGTGPHTRVAVGIAPDRSGVVVTFAGATQTVPAAALADGRWHHLAASFQAGSLELLVDGAVAGAVAGAPSAAGADLSLGEAFTGEIDEVRAWSVARDAPSILADLRRPLRGDEAGLTGYWRMDEGAGTELFDASPSFLDGTVALAAAGADGFAASTAWSRRAMTADQRLAADAGYDPDGDPLVVVITTAAQHGTATADASAVQVGYQPDAGHEGADAFAFALDDGSGPVAYALELEVTASEVTHSGADPFPWQVSGSGCGSAGGGGGLLALLLAGLGLGLRRSRSPAAARTAGVALALLAAGAARAQTTAAFQVERFLPTGGAYDLLGVQSAEVPGNLEATGRGYAAYSSRPLVLSRPGASSVALIAGETSMDLAASVGLLDRVELSAVLSGVIQQAGGRTALPPELGLRSAAAGISDARLIPKVRLLEWRRLALGLATPVSIPIGNQTAYLGHGSATVAANALAELEAPGPARLLVNAGAVFRPQRRVLDLTVGNAFTYGVGVEWPFRLGGQRLSALGTVAGEVGMKDAGPAARPMELLAGLRWTSPRGLLVSLGGGPGIGKGYGTPEYRVFAEVGFTTRPLARPAPEPVAQVEGPRAIAIAPPGALASVPAQDPFVVQPPLPLPAPAPAPPPPRVRVTKDKLVLAEKIFFDIGNASIKPESFRMLDAVAAGLERHPEVMKVRIEGHTDGIGKADENLALSHRRAEAVRTYLVGKGIDPARLSARGYGATLPSAPNWTASGREQNRRVEFIFVDEGLAPARATRESAPTR